MKKIIASIIGLILFSFLILAIYVYLTPFSSERLLPSQESVTQLSQFHRIGEVVQECLVENNIKTSQSEENVIKLLSGLNPKNKNYFSEIADLKPLKNREICDSINGYSYTVTFDGTNIFVHIPGTERPYIKNVNEH